MQSKFGSGSAGASHVPRREANAPGARDGFRGHDGPIRIDASNPYSVVFMQHLTLPEEMRVAGVLQVFWDDLWFLSERLPVASERLAAVPGGGGIREHLEQHVGRLWLGHYLQPVANRFELQWKRFPLVLP